MEFFIFNIPGRIRAMEQNQRKIMTDITNLTEKLTAVAQELDTAKAAIADQGGLIAKIGNESRSQAAAIEELKLQLSEIPSIPQSVFDLVRSIESSAAIISDGVADTTAGLAAVDDIVPDAPATVDEIPV